MITTLKERVAYQNIDFKIFDNKVSLECGEQTNRIRIEHRNHTDNDNKASAVAVLPLDAQGNLILIELEPYASKSTGLSVLTTNVNDESTDEAVRRSLLESTYLTSDDLTYCGRGYPLPELFKLDVALYIANNCTALPDDFSVRDSNSIKKIHTLSPVSAMQAIQRNDFADLTTQLLIKHYLLEILKRASQNKT